MIILFSNSETSSTHTFLEAAMVNGDGKEFFIYISLHYTSCQNLIILLLSTSNIFFGFKNSLPFIDQLLQANTTTFFPYLRAPTSRFFSKLSMYKISPNFPSL